MGFEALTIVGREIRIYMNQNIYPIKGIFDIQVGYGHD
jgi:hypothetical protein